jgi:hypothetical protein
MRKRALLVSAVAMVAVLVAGGLFASNMGFKLNYAMEKQGTAVPGGISRTGAQILALPYNQQTNLINAFDLIGDINTGQPAGSVAQIAQYVRSLDSFAGYTGQSGTAFNLVPGDAYLAALSTLAPATLNYIVVGSHNPGLGIDLTAQAAGASRTGSNLWSYPYHSTSANGFQLITEINAFAGAGTVVQIGSYVQSLDAFSGYTGTSGTAPQLFPGEGYILQVNSNVVDWVPSHY